MQRIDSFNMFYFSSIASADAICMGIDMKNFVFHTPTKVVFGKGTEKEVGQLIKAENCKKVLVHYGGKSAQKSGLLDSVYDSLKEAGIAFVSLGGVVPNPRLSKVYEGIELCKREGVDFILAVGGGSVIDSAKAISYGVVSECDVWDFFTRKAIVRDNIPVGAVLTIAAAGSEMSSSAVITNEDGWLKRGLNTEHGRCKFAVMNPELTYSLPSYQTQSGCTDILMHTMERYFKHDKGMELTDSMSEALMRTVIHNAVILLEEPDNYDARAEVMWAGSLSHNDLTGCREHGDWATHQLEHELGGMFDVAHGAGLAAIWGSWARYVFQEGPERFAQFAVNVMGIPNDFSDPSKVALEGIAALERFFRTIQMPVSISEMGIDLTEEQIEEMALKCTRNDTMTQGTFKVLKTEDIKAIFRMAR